MSVQQSTADPLAWGIRCAALLACGALSMGGLAACGVPERPHAAGASDASTDVYAWPSGAPDIAVLELKGRGEIRIALYAELAPNNVASFATRAESGYYDGVTFHRVIRDFMIQAGDPLTRDDDPSNDGKGGLSQPLDDEFSDAPFLRGILAVANKGRPNSGGSQFFIMHKDRRGMDGQYTVLGRVVSGLHLVDDVALSETDLGARWGPADRPIENIVIERIQIERAGATADSPSPTKAASDSADATSTASQSAGETAGKKPSDRKLADAGS